MLLVQQRSTPGDAIRAWRPRLPGRGQVPAKEPRFHVEYLERRAYDRAEDGPGGKELRGQR